MVRFVLAYSLLFVGFFLFGSFGWGAVWVWVWWKDMPVQDRLTLASTFPFVRLTRMNERRIICVGSKQDGYPVRSTPRLSSSLGFNRIWCLSSFWLSQVSFCTQPQDVPEEANVAEKVRYEIGILREMNDRL